MKKLLLLVFASLHLSVAEAQLDLDNGSFEDTIVINNQGTNVVQLRNWTTSSFGAGITTDAVAGSQAAYIWNWYYYGKGILINGDANLPALGGTPVSFRPDKMTGYYKYIIGDVVSSNDSAVVFVSLTKFNVISNKRDTIGFGTMKFGPVNNYQAFTVNISYSGSVQPDTILVRFISSENGFCDTSSNGNCLFLYVDDLHITNSATGISEDISLNAPELFPNPANDILYVRSVINEQQTLQIYNPEGRLVLMESLDDIREQAVYIGDLKAGLYFVRIGEKDTLHKLVKR